MFGRRDYKASFRSRIWCRYSRASLPVLLLASPPSANAQIQQKEMILSISLDVNDCLNDRIISSICRILHAKKNGSKPNFCMFSSNPRHVTLRRFCCSVWGSSGTGSWMLGCVLFPQCFLLKWSGFSYIVFYWKNSACVLGTVTEALFVTSD